MTSKNLIHLFQRLPLCLRDKEVDKKATNTGPHCEEDVEAPTNSVEHRRNNECNNKIVHPACGHPDGGSFGSDRDGENLSGQSPGARTPAIRKIDNIDPDKDY